MSQIAIIALINFWAPLYGIDNSVALAVAQHESTMNPNAIGALGEIGLFQLRPEFYKAYSADELRNPETNIILALEHLKRLKLNCVHKQDLNYLVCFNCGETNARKVKHPELFPYVISVRKLMLAQRGH